MEWEKTVNSEWVKHVWQNGSREHVISYHGGYNGSYQRCSVPNCEINKPEEHTVTDKSQAYGTDCRNGRCDV